jgi:hypothetical protein
MPVFFGRLHPQTLFTEKKLERLEGDEDTTALRQAKTDARITRTLEDGQPRGKHPYLARAQYSTLNPNKIKVLFRSQPYPDVYNLIELHGDPNQPDALQIKPEFGDQFRYTDLDRTPFEPNHSYLKEMVTDAVELARRLKLRKKFHNWE